jgi:hypothetical protein
VPIAPSDIKEYKSQAAASDGGAIDLTRPIASGGPNNLWDDITSSQAAAGGTDYRKVFRRNENSTLTWQAVVSFIQQQPQGATVSAGIGAAATADNDAAQGNMVAFSAPNKVSVVSSGADTRTATVIGEDAAGNRRVEVLILTGITPVLTSGTYSRLYAVQLSSTNPVNIVTVSEGSGGPTRGTIGPQKITCWLWRTGTDLSSR